MELTISQLIKIILGVFVFVLVIIGIYLFFRDTVIDFFKNLSGNETTEIFLGLIK
ncbi:hypothetical protein LCGC14_2939750 [marine sediment metagenome]|uniref:Uncharacterized protein n=1 Tax=marine sediment metagenome TaxID=412755 RepID=A0A0F8XIF4_9ZZZZ